MKTHNKDHPAAAPTEEPKWRSHSKGCSETLPWKVVFYECANTHFTDHLYIYAHWYYNTCALTQVNNSDLPSFIHLSTRVTRGFWDAIASLKTMLAIKQVMCSRFSQLLLQIVPSVPILSTLLRLPTLSTLSTLSYCQYCQHFQHCQHCQQCEPKCQKCVNNQSKVWQ